jgi:hypothetical protein
VGKGRVGAKASARHNGIEGNHGRESAIERGEEGGKGGTGPYKTWTSIQNLLRTALSIFSASTLDLNVWRPHNTKFGKGFLSAPEPF